MTKLSRSKIIFLSSGKMCGANSVRYFFDGVDSFHWINVGLHGDCVICENLCSSWYLSDVKELNDQRVGVFDVALHIGPQWLEFIIKVSQGYG